MSRREIFFIILEGGDKACIFGRHEVGPLCTYMVSNVCPRSNCGNNSLHGGRKLDVAEALVGTS